MTRYLRLFLLAIPWLGTWLVHREAEAQRARAQKFLDDLNDIALERLEVRDSEIVMELAKDTLAARIWAGIWVELLSQVNAPNFIEYKFAEPGRFGWITVTVQRVPGKTPADKLRDAEAEVERLRAQFKGHVDEPTL